MRLLIATATFTLLATPVLAQDWGGLSVGAAIEGSAAAISGNPSPSFAGSRIIGQLGYDMQLGPVVAGVRVEAGLGVFQTPITVNGGSATWSLGPTVAVTGRAGVAVGMFLPYAAGGVLIGTGTTSAATTGQSAGVTAGVGLEAQVLQPLSLRGEVRWTGRELTELTAMMPPGGTKVDLNEITASFGLVARF